MMDHMWLSSKDVPYRLAAMGVLNQLLLDGMPTLLWGLLVHNIKVTGLLHHTGAEMGAVEGLPESVKLSACRHKEMVST